MARSTLFLGLLFFVGCSGRPLGNHGGGGGGGGGGTGRAGGGGVSSECSGRDQASCTLDPACRADYCAGSCGNTFVGCADASSSSGVCPAKAPAQCDCAGLDEPSCIAAEKPWSCQPIYCPGSCGGPSAFAGCQGPRSGQIVCVVGGPAGCASSGCRNGADCSASGTDCLPPDGSSCVACVGSGCGGDVDCGAGQVCNYISCCGRSQCVPACTSDADCGNLRCAADGHCVSRSCTTKSQCPAHFVCDSTGRCGRQPCSSDSDCGGGYCVENGCYGQLGVCGGD